MGTGGGGTALFLPMRGPAPFLPICQRAPGEGNNRQAGQEREGGQRPSIFARCLGFISRWGAGAQICVKRPLEVDRYWLIERKRRCRFRLDLVLLPLFRAALAVAPSDRNRNIEIRRCLRHIHLQKPRIAERDTGLRGSRLLTKGLDDLQRDGPGKWRRYSVADLPGTMPFRFVKTEPIGEAV